MWSGLIEENDLMAAMAHLRSRRTSLLIASITGFAVAAAMCLPGEALADDSASCGAGAVVIAAGTNDPEGRHLVGVTQRYTGLGPNGQPDPNSQYAGDAGYKVIYADYPTTLWPLGAAGYDDSVAQGGTRRPSPRSPATSHGVRADRSSWPGTPRAPGSPAMSSPTSARVLPSR